MRKMFQIPVLALAGLACAMPVHAEADADEMIPPPLPRYREGGTPYNPNQSLKPFAIHRSDGTTQVPGESYISSPPEYDPVRGVVFKFITGHWHEVVVDCVANLTGDPAYDDIAYVVVNSQSQQNTATSLFIAAGADMSKVEFFINNNETVWLRDYGPHFIFQDDALAVVDSHYYPGRYRDNFVPTMFGDDFLDVPTYDMGLYYSGGNFLPGPDRSAFMSALVRLDNPTSQGFNDVLIGNLYEQFQGIDTMHILPQLPFSVDGTGHIDMWLYIVDEDDCIISEFKPGSNSTAITITNNAVTYMEDLGFTVHRPPAWNVGNIHYTYANAFRVNDRIFVPTYGEGNPSYLDEDAAALAAWEAAAGPDVEIVQINCYDIIPAAGAIHCIVKQLPRYVGADPAVCVVSPAGGELIKAGSTFPIKWEAIDTDNAAIDTVDIYYSPDYGITWETLALGEPDDGVYEWTVPAEETGIARIKVVAHGTDAGTGEATTNGYFEVADLDRHVYDCTTGAGVETVIRGHRVNNWSIVNGNRTPVADEIDTLVTGAYDKIAYSDTDSENDADPNRYNSPYSSVYTAHTFEIDIDEFPLDIRQITVQWEGYADDCAQTELYVWDAAGGNWSNGKQAYGQNMYLGTFAGNRDDVVQVSLQENLHNFINNEGKLTILQYVERNRNESFNDYFAVIVDTDAMDCVGDLNGDGTRDLADLGILLASYGVDDGGDIDGDGDTDLADLGELLSVYGTDC
jgi:agmatine deiminase